MSEDRPIDFSEVKTARNSLEALKVELRGRKATEALGIISRHLDVLEDKKRTKKIKEKVMFSNVTSEDLVKLGIERKRLVLVDAKISGLTKSLTPEAKSHMKDLDSRLKGIYDCVNMDHKSTSCRMVLDAMLLTLQRVGLTQQRHIVIRRDCTIGQHEDGVKVTNPDTQFELWLSGKTNYMVIEKVVNMSPMASPRVLGQVCCPPSKISSDRLFIVEAKHEDDDLDFFSSIPEAVSQAVAHMTSANLPEFRFCLSDGQLWAFFILKKSGNKLTYYESAKRCLNLDRDWGISDICLPELMELIHEWLSPTVTDIFKLKE